MEKMLASLLMPHVTDLPTRHAVSEKAEQFNITCQIIAPTPLKNTSLTRNSAFFSSGKSKSLKKSVSLYVRRKGLWLLCWRPMWLNLLHDTQSQESMNLRAFLCRSLLLLSLENLCVWGCVVCVAWGGGGYPFCAQSYSIYFFRVSRERIPSTQNSLWGWNIGMCAILLVSCTTFYSIYWFNESYLNLQGHQANECPVVRPWWKLSRVATMLDGGKGRTEQLYRRTFRLFEHTFCK